MAIRDPKVFARLEVAPGAQAGSRIHPLAVVEEGAEIGSGTRIWRFAHVRTGAVIGEQCIVGNSAYVDINVQVGHRVKIQNCALLYAGLTVDDEVFIGPNVTFTNDLYPRAMNADWEIVPTHICLGASIGANATIVCGNTVGAYAMIAAGSVVTHDVPPFTLVRGNPAQPAGYVCVCGRKLGGHDLDIETPVRCECGYIIDIAHERVLRP